MERKPKPEKESDDVTIAREVYDYQRIKEKSKTVRWLIVCAGVVICVWRICATIVQILDVPPWLTLCTTLLAAIVAPGGLACIVISKMQRGAKRRNDLIRAEQLKRDPKRTGSGLLPDGTDPPEEPK